LEFFIVLSSKNKNGKLIVSLKNLCLFIFEKKNKLGHQEDYCFLSVHFNVFHQKKIKAKDFLGEKIERNFLVT
jgi:hypothetical protein